MLDLPASASVEESDRPPPGARTSAYREDYQGYYDRNATPDSPAIRGADPLIVLVPGVGMFSFGKDKQTARVAGEFYVNAINVMRGAEGLSTYAPIDECGEVPHRVLGARGGQAPADAEAQAARDPRRARHRRRVGHRQGHREEARRRGRLRRHRRPVAGEGAGRGRRDRHRPTSPSACRSTSPTAPPSQAAVAGHRAGLRRCRPRRQQRRPVAVAARCSRPPSRTGTSSTT